MIQLPWLCVAAADWLEESEHSPAVCAAWGGGVVTGVESGAQFFWQPLDLLLVLTIKSLYRRGRGKVERESVDGQELGLFALGG